MLPGARGSSSGKNEDNDCVVNAAAPSVVTFGEVMLRLAAPDGTRLASARTLDATVGGGEAKVAASLAGFDVPAAPGG